VSLGLYGATAGISMDALLQIQNTYAGFFSNFGDAPMDNMYTNLAARNVFNTRLGYELYYSGRIK
jgi:hypothetical protein